MPVKIGRFERGFGGNTELLPFSGKCYILTRKAGSNLCRYRCTVPLLPEGIVRPERGGHNEIVIPEGVFYVYSTHLRQTINPNGSRNFAYIFEEE